MPISLADPGSPVADHDLNYRLASWWDCLPGDANGQTLRDLLGNYPATLTNGPDRTLWEERPAILYDGSDDYADAGDVYGAVTTDYAIAAWAVTTTTSGLRNLFFRGNSIAGQFGLLINFPGAGNWSVQFNGAANTYGSTVLSANTPYHFVYSVSAAGTVLYLNGLQDGSSGTTGTTTNGSAFTIGADAVNRRYWSGPVWDFRFYTRSLTADDAWRLNEQGLRRGGELVRANRRGLGPFVVVVNNLDDSDAGSSTETGSLSSSLSMSDAGSGADTGTISSSVAGTESGTATETGSVGSTVSATESATGADAATIASTLSATEAGSGEEVVSVASALAVTESGSGSDGTESISSSLSGAETGSGSEAAALSSSVSASESGSATESPSIASEVGGSENGSGADSPSIHSTLSDSDSLTAAETALLAAMVSQSDTGSGLEGSPSISSVVTGTESATATESPTLSSTVSGSDTGAGSDTGSVESQGATPIRRVRLTAKSQFATPLVAKSLYARPLTAKSNHQIKLTARGT